MIGEYIAPSIKVVENAIDNCDEILAIALGVPEEKWEQSAIGEDREQNEAIRNSRELNISYGLMAPKELFALSQAVYLVVRQYADENSVGFTHMERVSLLEYLPNQGFYDRHVDAGPTFPRSISAILYLNDVAEGGETWFDKFSLMIKPEKGKLIVFPSNYAYSHQAMPPISNTKYIAVTWFGQEIERGSLEGYYP